MSISSYRSRAGSVLVIAAMLVLSACGQKEAAKTMPAAATPEAAMSAEVPVTTASEEARALFMEGRALLDDLHFIDAHAKFVAAVEADPDFAMAHVMVANTSLTAEEFFDHVGKASAAAANASEGEQLYVQAQVAAAENDQAKQGETLKKLVSAYPKDVRTHMTLGNFLNGQQDFAGAAEHFMHATQIDPEYAPAQNSLGYAYRSLEDLDQAQAAFERYVELLPNESNPHDSLAELLMEVGNYEESIKHYQMALDIDPHFASSYVGISKNYSLMGEPEKSQEAASQMMAAARNFAERQNAQFLSATSYLFAGDTDAAMEVGNTMAAEAEAAGNLAAAGGIHEYMGDAMLNADDAAKAEEHYSAALAHRQNADINDAAKAQAKRIHLFKMAIAAMVAEDAEAAAERTAKYTAAAEANGTAFERRRIHELAGYMAMINDDMAAGMEHLAQASQLNPHVLYWSAVAQDALGDKDKAMELATRAANRNTLSQNLPFVRADALELLAKLNEA
ncbi:MAG: tetratricopeptide repeat protein [Gammaproteobacteria bacterium]|nr:tetratricopeptide repeat protein [Gammaproteobacteria bacterium]MBU2677718.1 tetratricopeptide repeat protein [Gammaproteobacteria bacterium]NNL51451.1 tetratricopeptide repeat protein [Woeseiaceae bacterium]